MKKATSLFKVVMLFLAVVVCAGIAKPQNAFAKNAKNPSVVKLKLNQTYSKYDVTGDGKADKIRIGCYKNDEYCIEGLKITINGRTVLSKKNSLYYRLCAKLCTLQNGKVFLYVYNPYNNEDADICALFQYQNGKLKKCIDMNKFYGSNDLGYHTKGEVKSVKGNKITVEIYQQTYQLGGMSVTFDYKYSKGKLIKDGIKAKKYQIWAYKENGSLTASRNMTVYQNVGCSSKAFTLSTGQKIKILGVYCKSGNMMIKIKRISDGKTGYLKCIKKFPSSGDAPFYEVAYAG